MPIIRKFAVQGHELPKGAYSPGNPFAPEITRNTGISYTDIHGDSLHEGLDDVRLFRCKYCGNILYEDELVEHECDDESFPDAQG